MKVFHYCYSFYHLIRLRRRWDRKNWIRNREIEMLRDVSIRERDKVNFEPFLTKKKFQCIRCIEGEEKKFQPPWRVCKNTHTHAPVKKCMFSWYLSDVRKSGTFEHIFMTSCMTWKKWWSSSLFSAAFSRTNLTNFPGLESPTNWLCIIGSKTGSRLSNSSFSIDANIPEICAANRLRVN